MRRNKRGVAGINARRAKQEIVAAQGEKMERDELAHLDEQFKLFKTRLEHFAKNHREDISKDARVRRQFQEMCAAIGVDPLASSRGFWAETLGVGDFYYELAVRVVEYCMANRTKLGGLIQLSVISDYLKAEEHDIRLALKKLTKLGSGYSIIGSGRDAVVQVAPGEFTQDAADAVKVAQGSKGRLTCDCLVKGLGWTGLRARHALDQLRQSGTVWYDECDQSYWFPALF